jgi:hypothetical protein
MTAGPGRVESRSQTPIRSCGGRIGLTQSPPRAGGRGAGARPIPLWILIRKSHNAFQHIGWVEAQYFPRVKVNTAHGKPGRPAENARGRFSTTDGAGSRRRLGVDVEPCFVMRHPDLALACRHLAAVPPHGLLHRSQAHIQAGGDGAVRDVRGQQLHDLGPAGLPGPCLAALRMPDRGSG